MESKLSDVKIEFDLFDMKAQNNTHYSSNYEDLFIGEINELANNLDNIKGVEY